MDHRIDFAALEWLEWAEIGTARAKTAIIPGTRLRLVQFSPGFEQTGWCDRGHIGYIVNGEMETEFDGGKRVTYGAGDGLVILRGTRHRSKNIGKGPVLLFIVESMDRPREPQLIGAAEAGAPRSAEESDANRPRGSGSGDFDPT